MEPLMEKAFRDATAREESINGKAYQSKTTGCDEPCRLSLQKAVEGQLNRAMRETRRAERLHELAYLLNKHPDIARILDLVDEVRR